MGLNTVDLGSLSFTTEQYSRVLPTYDLAKKEFLSDFGFDGSDVVAPVMTKNHKGKITGSGRFDITAIGITQGDLEDIEAYRDAGTQITFENYFYSYTVVIVDFQETLGNDKKFDVNIQLDVIE